MVNIFKLTNLIDIVLSILNIKFDDSAIFLSNYIEILSYYKAFSLLILFINWVKTFKLISNSLNMISSYYKIVNKLKI